VPADVALWPGMTGRQCSPARAVRPPLAAVPAEPVDLAGAVVVALLLAVLGLMGYARRDLRS
jgi:hypothetical protein